MQLSLQQVAQFEADGYVVLHALFSGAEVETLRAEIDRLAGIETEYIKRERNGAPRSILRVHELDGATRSPAFRALTRTPRLMKPVAQLIGDDQLYIYHTKINVKAGFDGGIYAWHQDFGTWQRDGAVAPVMLTAMVMLDDSEEINGALYFVPGSHKLGSVEHVEDPAIGALNPLSVDREKLTRILESKKPVAITGVAGTTVIFHSNMVHGSGHNMSPRDRRQVYVVYNPVSNKPLPVEKPRGDHVCSRNVAPIAMGDDDAILMARSSLPVA